MKAIKVDDTGSVLIRANGLNVWVDVWKDSSGELVADWNKYIFYLGDSNDVAIKEFQENCENFDEVSSLAIHYYEENFRN